MKKNWLPIAALIGFIFLYNFLVVQPYSQKHFQNKKIEPRDLPTQGLAASTTLAPGVAQVTRVDTKSKSNSSAEYLPPQVNLKNQLLDESSLVGAFALSFNKDRSVTFYPDGTIGRAVFEDYFERELSTKEAVVLLPHGFRFTSTDPAIADCLNTLELSSKDDSKVLFQSQTPRGSCELNYSLSKEKAGLVFSSLEIRGFPGSKGFVEIKGVGDLGKGTAQDHNYLSFKLNGSEEKIRDKTLFDRGDFQGSVEWLVWGDRYFTSVILPRGRFNPNVFHVVANTQGYTAFGFAYPVFPEGNDNQRIEFDFFFGTRDVDTLAAVHAGLEQTVDFGWFRAVSQAMLWCLKAINQFVHNYGVSIVILTLLVRVLFWPLNKKVFQSSLKMKAIQPQVEALKKRFADKKSREAQQQMNVEMLGLYRKNGVNPMGSCLPLLLQMPIFIGLYGALNHSMDLYQAPFFGWIQDLSSKDPFYVFPVLWTISLLGYIKLNPMPQNNQPGMPDMKWIMVAMNLFFGFLSKDWPAGLTIYLFVSNLVGITQQFVMKRQAEKLQPIQEGA